MVRNKHNPPVIMKYPFWQMTAANPKAVYACVNYGEAACLQDIEKQSICLNGDIGEAISDILKSQADLIRQVICRKHMNLENVSIPNDGHCSERREQACP